jgi:hypothetical protein
MKEEFEEQLMSTESRIKKYFHHDANGNLIKWFRPVSSKLNLCGFYGDFQDVKFFSSKIHTSTTERFGS